MTNYKFSANSLERLNTLHPLLKHIALQTLDRSPIDFCVVEGHRSIERQKQLFKEGKSQIDGVSKKGNHNYSPSRAVDLCPWMENRMQWQDRELFCLLAGAVIATAQPFLAGQQRAGRAGISLRWGGDWNMNGVPFRDQSFDDLPHFELITKDWEAYHG